MIRSGGGKRRRPSPRRSSFGSSARRLCESRPALAAVAWHGLLPTWDGILAKSFTDLQAGRFGQLGSPIGLFPGEVRIVAAKMPARGRLAEDGPSQLEILDDPPGSQREDLTDGRGDPLFGHLGGA